MDSDGKTTGTADAGKVPSPRRRRLPGDLRFSDPEQERRYLATRDLWLRNRILYIAILTAIVFGAFLFVDATLPAGQFRRLLVLRICISGMLVAIGIASRVWQGRFSTSAAGILLAVVVYAGLFLNRTEVGLNHLYDFTAGLILIHVGCWFVGSLTFVQAAVINSIAFVIWIALEWFVVQEPPPSIVLDVIYLLATGLICAFAAWQVENLFRRNFAAQEVLIAQELESRNRALRDGLTGLWNRAAMVERLATACRRSASTQLQGALLMIDLDGFKPVNDRHGHQAGDEVLIAIARRVQSVLRPSDSVGRIGGDEFLILVEDLPDPDFARQLAERIRKEIESPIRVRLHGDSASVAVTVGASIGTSTFSGTIIAPAEIINVADQDMYRDKARRKGAGVETR